MKRFISAAAVAAYLLLGFSANAKIYRVNYPGPHRSDVDISDLQTAIYTCSTTKVDTIFLYPGTYLVSYDRAIVTIGFGYYTDTVALGTGANAGLQNIVGSISADLRLNSTASGCIFEGIDGLVLRNNNLTPLDNITVKRCNGALRLLGSTDGSTIFSDWSLLQSDLDIITYNYNNRAFSSFFDRLLVSNCIIRNFLTTYSGTQNGMFFNNIFTAGWDDPSFTFENNIFLYNTGSFAVTSTSTYNYNLFVESKPTGIKGGANKYNVNQDAIFVGYTNQNNYSNDSKWVLKSNSPAKGAGRNSIDCGIYSTGSNYPYKPSGIPAIPAFYRLDAPSTTTGNTSTYQITFSVRGNN